MFAAPHTERKVWECWKRNEARELTRSGNKSRNTSAERGWNGKTDHIATTSQTWTRLSQVSGCPPGDGGRLLGPPSFSWCIFIPVLFCCFLCYWGWMMLSSQLTYQVDRLPCSLPSVSVPVDVIIQLSVSANSHVNAMRCSMFSSHASSASLDGGWRSLNLSVTTGRAAARHQKIWASLTQITEAVIKLCFCTVTLCVLLSYTSMFVQIK